MRMIDAMKIIENGSAPSGYMVHFERIEGSMLVSDYFPEKRLGEPLINTEQEAWDLAKRFAAATYGRCVNIYVIGENYAPVPGYEGRKIVNR
jgi:hypothetical protein